MAFTANYKNRKGISVFENLEEMSESLFNLIISDFSRAQNEKRPYHLALSGGNTPIKIFRYLSKKPMDQLNWEFLHLYWGDERFVPQNDPESNFGNFYETVLRYINIPEANIHRIRGESDPAEETQRYSEVLRNNVPLDNGYPRFDMILLGIGEDGHTASIFPDCLYKLDSDELCYVAVHPVNHQKRLTLSMKVLNNAYTVLFLASGTSKAGIISEVVNMKRGAEIYPAAHVCPVNGNLKWFIDKDAGRKLKKRFYFF